MTFIGYLHDTLKSTLTEKYYNNNSPVILIVEGLVPNACEFSTNVQINLDKIRFFLLYFSNKIMLSISFAFVFFLVHHFDHNDFARIVEFWNTYHLFQLCRLGQLRSNFLLLTMVALQTSQTQQTIQGIKWVNRLHQKEGTNFRQRNFLVGKIYFMNV